MAINRQESERFRSFTHDELMQCDKVSMDVFWLRDEGLEDSANLPPPGVIGAEIMEDLQAALEEFAQVAVDLGVPDEEAARPPGPA